MFVDNVDRQKRVKRRKKIKVKQNGDDSQILFFVFCKGVRRRKTSQIVFD